MLELYDIPSKEWEEEYNSILQDAYIKKKYSRRRRLNDKKEYVNLYLPQLKTSKGNVLDLGPGFGEFMEVCRSFGCNAIGIDAPTGDSEMGNEYLRLSQLMAIRQKLDVRYIGVERLLRDNKQLPFDNEYFDVVNSQGAIEQIFKDHLIGVPHQVHKNSNLLAWNMNDDLKKEFRLFYQEVKRILKPNGICLIYGNGAKNVAEYDLMIKAIIANIDDLEIIWGKEHRFHKIRKVK